MHQTTVLPVNPHPANDLRYASVIHVSGRRPDEKHGPRDGRLEPRLELRREISRERLGCDGVLKSLEGRGFFELDR